MKFYNELSFSNNEQIDGTVKKQYISQAKKYIEQHSIEDFINDSFDLYLEYDYLKNAIGTQKALKEFALNDNTKLEKFIDELKKFSDTLLKINKDRSIEEIEIIKNITLQYSDKIKDFEIQIFDNK